MLKISARMEIPEVDHKAYGRALLDHVEKILKGAGREFAKTALLRIPVRTGFVSGSFGNLVDLVGAGARFNPIIVATRRAIANFLSREDQAAGARREYYYPPGGGKILKTPQSGRGFATAKDKIFQRTTTSIIFTFQVDIRYFTINDLVSGHAPTAPWGAFIAGEIAFNQYVEKNLTKDIPRIEEYVRVRTQRIV